MKYSILVQDLTADQARFLVNELDGGQFFDTAGTATAAAPTPAPAPPATIPSHFTGESEEVSETAEVELDKEGLPWDERIHSGSKKQTAKGVWKKRKGVQEVVFDEVVAELRNQAEGVEAAPAAAVETVAAAPTPPPPQTPPAPAANVPAAPPAPAAAVAPAHDFQGLMQQVSKLFGTQQITPDYPQTVVTRINDAFSSNIATLTDIANDVDMVNYAWECLKVDGKAA